MGASVVRTDLPVGGPDRSRPGLTSSTTSRPGPRIGSRSRTAPGMSLPASSAIRDRDRLLARPSRVRARARFKLLSRWAGVCCWADGRWIPSCRIKDTRRGERMGFEHRHRGGVSAREELEEELARTRELLLRAEQAAAEDPQARSVRQWFALLLEEEACAAVGWGTALTAS